MLEKGLVIINNLIRVLNEVGPKVNSEAAEEYNERHPRRAITPHEAYNYLTNKNYFTVLGQVSFSKELGRYLHTYKTALYASNYWLEKQEYTSFSELVQKYKPKRDIFRRRKYGKYTVKDMIKLERDEIITGLIIILNELGPKISSEAMEEYNLLCPENTITERQAVVYLNNEEYFTVLGKVKGPKRMYGKSKKLRTRKVTLYASNEWLEKQKYDSLEELICSLGFD